MEQKENAVQQNTDTTQDKSKTKSHNPVLKKIASSSVEPGGKNIATETGTIRKGIFLIALTILSACTALWLHIRIVLAIGILILAFCTGLRIFFHPKETRWLSPVYALLEGLALIGMGIAIFRSTIPWHYAKNHGSYCWDCVIDRLYIFPRLDQGQ